jgi:hypothetical protein
LNVVDDGSIVDAASNPLAGPADGGFTGQVFTLDRTPPTLLSIVRAGASPTNANSVSWTVTFSESVTGVGTSDFGLVRSGISGGSISSVSGSGATRTVTSSTGTGNGTLGLNLTSVAGIVDGVGNGLSATLPVVGDTYTIDKVAPTVTVNQAVGQADPTKSSPIAFTIVFSEPPGPQGARSRWP